MSTARNIPEAVRLKSHRLSELVSRDLGRIPYADAYAIQQETHAHVLAGDAPPTVLLLEHDPVITVTKRDSAAGHLLASPEFLKQRGVALTETDRGGDITYHGPGQLVAYPIVPLQPLGLNVRQYIASLEDTIIDTLAAFDVVGRRDPAGIGVWVDPLRIADCGLRNKENPKSEIRNQKSAKIAAIGVRVRRWVTLHGLALNVSTNLDHFRLIVPCGLPRPVTSLHQLLGDHCPTMDRVKSALIGALTRTFADSPRPCSGPAGPA